MKIYRAGCAGQRRRQIIRILARRATLLLSLLFPEAVLARTESEPRVASGPTTITQEERAREADPATGVVDAVILIEETRRLETSFGRAKVWYHARAKVLSETGVRLATVEIPNVDGKTKVQKWWGHVLLPSGAAFTLPEEKLEDKVDPTTGERSITAKFSRAVPGCVLDWGYVVTGTRVPAFEIVPLQREWFVDRLRYRWRRIGSSDDSTHIGGYQVQHPTPGLDVTRDNQGALLSAERLPSIATDPDGRIASLALWTLHPISIPDGSLVVLSKVEEQFWSDRASRIETQVADFAGSPERLRRALETIPFPPGGDVDERLRFAYAWIDENVQRRPGKWTGIPGIGAVRTKGRADKVLAAREGGEIDRTLTFVAVARGLGAEASLILATDATAWPWDRGMLLVEQFSHALVEVRVPGATPVLVAMGSGLPYGEIPAVLSGGKALKATKAGAQFVEIPKAGGP